METRTIAREEGDTMLARSSIGKRVFVLACHLTKHHVNCEEWVERSRTIAREAAAALFRSPTAPLFRE